ncbi:MAG TPA: ORF6N domain-containing protein [Prolixibacteraceae bacterium]|nr:ORF6N domain-containing protein [Prolixibacteraceae bacterium]
MEIAINQREIENRIFTIRGIQVMIDRDLAEVYSVDTKVLNQAVKRNIERFPEIFRFQLSGNEKNELVTNCDRFENLKHSSALPYAFTEQGVSMLSAVLRSDTAIRVSIQIMNAFVEMRKLVLNNAGLFQRLDKMEVKQIEADQKFEQIFKALESREHQPEKGIFFEGQVFDAYAFVSGIIKKANKSIILIDNYVDETVLTILAKRDAAVMATIYTKQISKQLELDLKKHKVQYPEIAVKILTDSHDRFLIIDQQELYHIGASLKDLGKKWFAFSRMDSLTGDVLNKLKG